MEDSLCGLKPSRLFDLDNRNSDVVDNNDNTPSTIENADMETIKLSRKKNRNKLNRSDVIKLLNFITLKLPTDFLSEPLHVVNDNATNKLFASVMSM